jgi:deoxyadenosine/deoxycytidine kinase
MLFITLFISLTVLIAIAIAIAIAIVVIYKYIKINSNKNILPKYKIISLDGNIGAGKTTLLNMLKRYITNMNIKNIHIIKEPVDLWERTGILEKFYKDKNKIGAFFQLFVLETLIDALRSKINELTGKYNMHYIITERSIESTRWVFAQMLYDDGIISKEEMKCYFYVYDSSENKKFIPLSIIYLNTPPEICAERIIKRSRGGENSINDIYLQKTNNYYINMISSIKENIKEKNKQPLLEINYNEYDINNEECCNKIIQFINK